jgi:predicted GNAT family N-acyltransferase
VSEPPGYEYRVEPLSAFHDRAAFHSGSPELDHYFHQQAGQDARRRVAAPFVMLDETESLVGYYTLSAYSVQSRELPEAVARKLPRYPLLPATLLGRLAIAAAYRGKKLGHLLLMDALYRSLRSTSEVASVGVVVEALDDAALEFYRHHEFRSLADRPNRLFLPMLTIEKAYKAG